MKVNRTLSEIIRGVWAMNPEAAKGYLPLAASIIKGEVIHTPEPNAYWGDGDRKAEAIKEASAEVKGVSVFRKKDRWASFNDAPDHSIAEIAIEGPLMKAGDCGEPGYQAFTDWIKEADASPRIDAILLRMDSPGGAVYGVATMADAIKATTKPVIAFVDDGIAASAGYWLASHADEIVLSQAHSQVGSIGVFTTLADWYGYFEKEGLKVKDVYARQSSDKNGDYREALSGNEDPLKDHLSALASTFIATVKANRGERLNLSAGDPFTGKMYMAQEAIQLGLADRIASYEEVVLSLAMTKKDKESNSNTMAKQNARVNAALGVESLESTDEGVFLNAEQLEALDTALDTSALQQQVDDASANVQSMQDAQSAHLAVLNAQLTAAGEEEVTDMQAGITRLGSLVQEYGKAAGSSFTSVKPGKQVEEKDGGLISADAINEEIARKSGVV